MTFYACAISIESGVANLHDRLMRVQSAKRAHARSSSRAQLLWRLKSKVRHMQRSLLSLLRLAFVQMEGRVVVHSLGWVSLARR